MPTFTNSEEDIRVFGSPTVGAGCQCSLDLIVKPATWGRPPMDSMLPTLIRDLRNGPNLRWDLEAVREDSVKAALSCMRLGSEDSAILYLRHAEQADTNCAIVIEAVGRGERVESSSLKWLDLECNTPISPAR